MKKKKAALICKIKQGDWKCKNVCGENKLQLCEKHFKIHKEFLAQNPSLVSKENREIFGIDTPILTKKKKEEEEDLPPDELRCCFSSGRRWRCKNVRMWVDAAKEDGNCNVRKSRHCRHHYNYFVDWEKKKKEKNKMKRCGHGEGKDSGCTTNCSTKRRKKTQLPATTSDKSESDKECGFANIIGTKRNKVTEDDLSIDQTGIQPATTSDTSNKEKELPPDEQRCCVSSRTRWRCKNVRLRVDASVDNSNVDRRANKKKRSRDGEAEGTAAEAEDDLSVVETGIQLTTNRTSDSDKSIEGGSVDIGTKRKTVKRTECSGELESLTRNKDPVVELESRECYKSKCVRLALDLEEKKMECTNLQGKLAEVDIRMTAVTEESKWTLADLEGRVLRMEKEKATMGCLESRILNLERTERSGDLESLIRTRDPVLELESLEHYKSECVKLATELEKKKVECTTLQGKLVEIDNRMTAVKDDTERTLADAAECWKKMFSDLESRFLRMEKEKSTTGCVEPRILNSENMVLRKDNLNSTMAGSVDSRISKLESLNLRIEDENLTRLGCVESRLPYLESLVLRSNKAVVKVVSDDGGESSGQLFKEDSDNFIDPKSSPGDLVYKLAINNRNRSRDKEMKWNSEDDMVSSFEDDPELCLKAVCALYRQLISEDETSAKHKQLFIPSDTLRVTTLAKFLMDGDCKGGLKKSVKDLEIFDSEAIKDCKTLARRYSYPLFSVYQNGEDPYFIPPIPLPAAMISNF